MVSREPELDEPLPIILVAWSDRAIVHPSFEREVFARFVNGKSVPSVLDTRVQAVVVKLGSPSSKMRALALALEVIDHFVLPLVLLRDQHDEGGNVEAEDPRPERGFENNLDDDAGNCTQKKDEPLQQGAKGDAPPTAGTQRGHGIEHADEVRHDFSLHCLTVVALVLFAPILLPEPACLFHALALEAPIGVFPAISVLIYIPHRFVGDLAKLLAETRQRGAIDALGGHAAQRHHAAHASR